MENIELVFGVIAVSVVAIFFIVLHCVVEYYENRYRKQMIDSGYTWRESGWFKER